MRPFARVLALALCLTATCLAYSLAQVGDPEAYVTDGRMKINITPQGNLGRTYLSWGSGEQQALTDLAGQEREPRPIHFLALIVRNASVDYNDRDGSWHHSEDSLTDQEVEDIKTHYAEFLEDVVAYSGGALKPVSKLLVIDEVYTAKWEKFYFPGPFADFISKYTPYERGDFDCVIGWFPQGHSNLYAFGATIGGTDSIKGAANSNIAYIRDRLVNDRVLRDVDFHEWMHQVEWATYAELGIEGLPGTHDSGKNGYGSGQLETDANLVHRDLLHYYFTPGILRRLTFVDGPGRKVGEAEVSLNAVRPVGAAWRPTYYDWDEVKDEPWTRLPRFDSSHFKALTGLPDLEVGTGPDYLFLKTASRDRIDSPRLDAPTSADTALNTQLNLQPNALEGIAWLHYQAKGAPLGEYRDLLLIRPDLVSPVLNMLRFGLPHPDRPHRCAVVGYVLMDTRAAIVVDTEFGHFASLPKRELDLVESRSGNLWLRAEQNADVVTPGQPLPVTFTIGTDGGEPVVLESAEFAIRSAGELDLEGTPALPTAVSSGEPVTFLLAGASAETLGPQVVTGRFRWREGEAVHEAMTAACLRIAAPFEMEVQMDGASVVGAKETAVQVRLTNWGHEPLTGTLNLGLPSGWSASRTGFTLAAQEGTSVTLTVPIGISNGRLSEPSLVKIEGEAVVPDTVMSAKVSTSAVWAGDVLFHQGFEQDVAWQNPVGKWSAALDGAAEEGTHCARLSDGGGCRWGSLRLVGGGAPWDVASSEWRGYDTDQYPLLDFWFRTESAFDTGFIIATDAGSYVVPLTGTFREQWGERKPLEGIAVTADGQWHHYTYDLDAALDKVGGAGRHLVTEIRFGEPRSFISNQYGGADGANYWFDNFRIEKTAPAGGGEK